MGARSGGGAGMGRGAGGFTGATAKVFGSRIGTKGTFNIIGANGRKNFSGGKDYEVYVQGDKGSGTFSFKSASEGNKFVSQISKNGFSAPNGYWTQFNG